MLDLKFRLLLFFGLSAMLTSCSGQNKTLNDPSIKSNASLPKGDTVTDIGHNIMVVYQDKNNIYWFGSWETGLYRYNGKTIIHYTTKHGLTNNRIDEIKEDKYGNLYLNSCYPVSAITKFDGSKFVQLKAEPGNDWKLLPDGLWFKASNNSRHIYRFDGRVLYELQFPKHPKFDNPFEIYSIYKDKKGYIWFGSNPVGVCRYNGKTFDWITEDDVTELHGGPANGIRSIIEDKEGYFWFNSAFRYKVSDSAATERESFYKRIKSIGSLDGKEDGNLQEYLSIAKDPENNLWIATYRNGIWKYDGVNVKHYPVKENGKDLYLFYIYCDNFGNLWLGTHENGVWKFNGNTFEKIRL